MDPLVTNRFHWSDKFSIRYRVPKTFTVLNNVGGKRASWFHFDVDYGNYLYLNGLPREEQKNDLM